MASDFHFDIRRGRSDIDDDFENATGITSDDIINTIADARSGTSASAALLKAWVSGECYELTAITRDADEVVTTATVKWPDGSGGTFTTVTKNGTWLTIDAFTVGHTLSGKTVTQPAVTRDSGGAVTTKPALTVA